MLLFLFGHRCPQKIEIRCHTHLGDDSDNGLTTGCKAPQSLPFVFWPTLLSRKVQAQTNSRAAVHCDFSWTSRNPFGVSAGRGWEKDGKGMKRAQQHKMALNRQLSQQKQLSAEKKTCETTMNEDLKENAYKIYKV